MSTALLYNACVGYYSSDTYTVICSYITCDFLDTKIITEAKNHDVNIEFDFFTIAYMRDLEKYRNFFETNPLSFYIHDRDPSDGSHCGYVGRADFCKSFNIMSTMGSSFSSLLTRILFLIQG